MVPASGHALSNKKYFNILKERKARNCEQKTKKIINRGKRKVLFDFFQKWSDFREVGVNNDQKF